MTTELTPDRTVTCHNCGACCLNMAVPPYEGDEIESLILQNQQGYVDLILARELRTVQLQLVGTDEIPCLFLDPFTRKCRHHEHKPQVCRDFEVGGEHCLATRRDAGLDEWGQLDDT